MIGIGVGPGDPELVTLKAARTLERVTVVAFIAAAGRASRAREIAAPYLRHGPRELLAVLPMTADAAAAEQAYARLATGIRGELDQGTDVAFLCEGDAMLYGSLVRLLESLSAGGPFACEIIPGVTSIAAAAAMARWPLASGDTVLTIVPATAPEALLDAALAQARSVVVLKVGRHLPSLRRALGRAGLLGGALLIENVTTGAQRMRPLAEVGEEAAPYFSLVLARKEQRHPDT